MSFVQRDRLGPATPDAKIKRLALMLGCKAVSRPTLISSVKKTW
jgi:hypothetical protein